MVGERRRTVFIEIALLVNININLASTPSSNPGTLSSIYLIIAIILVVVLVVVLVSATVDRGEYHFKLVKYYFSYFNIRFKLSNSISIIFFTLNYSRFRN